MKTNKKLKVRLSVTQNLCVVNRLTERAYMNYYIVVHVSLTLSADIMSADMILDS